MIEENARHELDPYLDRLYNSNVRCPYCKARIVKYSTTCPRCGIHKQQIYEASNVKAKQIMKEKSGKKIFMVRHRPNDVSFVRMCMLLIPGLWGAHCFYVGRKVRGFIMLAFMLVSILSFITPLREPFMEMVGDLNLVGEVPVPFPTDLFFLAAFFMWAYDVVAVVFGFFKYPARLGDPIKIGGNNGNKT